MALPNPDFLTGVIKIPYSDRGPYFSVFGPVSRMLLFYRAYTLKWFALTDFQSNFTKN